MAHPTIKVPVKIIKFRFVHNYMEYSSVKESGHLCGYVQYIVDVFLPYNLIFFYK